jgi:hypothetical protein
MQSFEILTAMLATQVPYHFFRKGRNEFVKFVYQPTRIHVGLKRPY